ncbi:tyrosine-type recombinase/integrase [Paenibacillus sp. LHD-38]|uniref:tyrosine-type recombinase/integrase n=1 Tax=Paenibacillus sp. LHD-38 TaxID=3072143 RepID=UPI00280F914B|nr:tyrosine-type recombinase/integrase [Paenibacillus sp. LHD-38]MDQ8738868.1 tyrosine-type recombinase/integrase [Paenibacillus sp. LHD-38]
MSVGALKRNQTSYFNTLSDSFFENKYSIKEAKVIIKRLKADGVMASGEFEDFTWTFYIDESMTVCKVDFSEIMHFIEVTTMLKCWSSERLLEIQAKTLSHSYGYIPKIVNLTQSFAEECVDNLIYFLVNDLTENMRNVTLRTLMNFLDYSELEYKELYLNQLNDIYRKSSSNKNTRDLPAFRDVLIFGSVLERFMSEWNEHERLLFYPIVLWWKITNIIPLRPKEFCAIKRDCLTRKNSSFYITVPRKKQKATMRLVELVDTLEINRDIYKMVQDYINLTNSFGETKTLISYRAYSKSINVNGGKRNLNFNSYRFHYNNLDRLLLSYYERIVKKKYGYEDLEQVRPGDTRHFAFCSMMLQGFNALSIARIGGHRSIESQYHYQQHMKYFADSKVYHLSRLFRYERIKGLSSISNIELEHVGRNFLKDRQQFAYLKEMDVGYCTDPNMACESDLCQFCSKWWVSREEFKLHESEIRNRAAIKEKNINDRIAFMEKLRNEMEYDLSNNEYSLSDQENLSREAKLLQGDMVDLAKLYSYVDDFED